MRVREFIESKPWVRQSGILLFFALVSAASIAFQGFEFPFNNNVFHVPLVLDYTAAEEGPHDLFHLTLQNFVSPFWQLLSPISTEDTIYDVFLAVHFSARVAVLVFMYLAVRQIVNSGDRLKIVLGIASIPMCAVALDDSPFGVQEIFKNYLTQSEIVLVFVLGSWLSALKRKWILAAAIIGLGFNVNAFIALWSALGLGVAKLWTGRSSSIKDISRETALMIGASAACAAPALVWIWATIADGTATTVSYDFRELLLDYFPYHWFVHLQPHNAIKLALLCCVLAVGLHRLTVEMSPIHTHILAASAAALLVILLFGLLLPYFTANRFLLLLIPLRMDGFIVLLVLLVVIARFGLTKPDSVFKKLPPYPIMSLLGLAHGNLPLLLAAAVLDWSSRHRLARPVRVGTGLVFVALGLHVAFFSHLPFHSVRFVLWHAQEYWFLMALAAAAIPCLFRNEGGVSLEGLLFFALGFNALCSMSELSSGWPITKVGQTPWALAATYISFGIFFARESWTRKARRAFAITVCAIIALQIGLTTDSFAGQKIFSCLAFILGMAAARFKLFSAGDRVIQLSVLAAALAGVFISVGYAMVQSPDLSRVGARHKSWLEAQYWARANTPTGTVFLTPPTPGGFATLSRRPVWIDWKSGSAALWWPDFYPLWKRRMSEIRALRSTSDWFDYGRAHDLDYVIFDLRAFEKAELDEVEFKFRNRHFGISKTAADF